MFGRHRVQLHGNEDGAYMASIDKPVVKVIHVQPTASIEQVHCSHHRAHGLCTADVFKREKFSLAGARFTGIARAWVCVRGACCSNCDAATTVEVVAALQVLLDTKVGNASGGTGKTFDWSIAAQVQQKGVPVFVAGGTLPRSMRAE